MPARSEPTRRPPAPSAFSTRVYGRDEHDDPLRLGRERRCSDRARLDRHGIERRARPDRLGALAAAGAGEHEQQPCRDRYAAS